MTLSAVLTGALMFVMFVGVLGQRAAYRNGFEDGARWERASTYPSKPEKSWEGWARLKR